MDEISEIEAQRTLASLLDQVEQGREVTITRDGRPVARLLAPVGRRSAVEAMQDLRALRTTICARGDQLTVEEIVAFRDEGRR